MAKLSLKYEYFEALQELDGCCDYAGVENLKLKRAEYILNTEKAQKEFQKVLDDINARIGYDEFHQPKRPFKIESPKSDFASEIRNRIIQSHNVVIDKEYISSIINEFKCDSNSLFIAGFETGFDAGLDDGFDNGVSSTKPEIRIQPDNSSDASDLHDMYLWAMVAGNKEQLEEQLIIHPQFETEIRERIYQLENPEFLNSFEQYVE